MAVVWGAWAGEVENDAERIAHGLRKRDVGLLNGLIVQYQYRLLRYLVHLAGRQDLADDLGQDTWLRVLERGSQYDGHSRFEPWLFTIARNLAIDHMRRRRTVSLEPEDDGESPSPISSEPSPFILAART